MHFDNFSLCVAPNAAQACANRTVLKPQPTWSVTSSGALAGFPASRAIDGSIQDEASFRSFWATPTSAAGQYITFDYSTPLNLVGFVYYPRTGLPQNISGYTIQSSNDGVTFTTIQTGSIAKQNVTPPAPFSPPGEANVQVGNPLEVDFITGVTARYLRLIVNSTHEGGLATIAELLPIVCAPPALNTISCANADLLNTGTNASGAGLAPEDKFDNNWEVAYSPKPNNYSPVLLSYSDIGNATFVPAVITGNKIPAFWANSPYGNANWISYTETSRDVDWVNQTLPPTDPNTYFFRYRFNITDAYLLSAFKLRLNFLSDNEVQNIYINGVGQAPQFGLPGGGFTLASQTQTVLKNNWQLGQNEIVVQVYSQPAYAGFLGQNIASCPGLDFGDAPASYNVSRTTNGAGHIIEVDPNDVVTLKLGNLIDSEANGVASFSANADDTSNLDDEDGVASFPVIQGTNNLGFTNYTVNVALSNITSFSANLCGWIDWNNNGVFDASESACVAVANGATSAQLVWPSTTLTGVTGSSVGTYARFRITTDALAGNSANGAASNGEVEDYFIPFCIIPAPTATLVTPSTICSGAPVTINYTSNPPDQTVQWVRMPGGVTGVGNFTDFPTATGTTPVSYTYSAWISNAAGSCSSTTTVTTVLVNPVPIITPSVCSQTICSGQTGAITFTSTIPGSTINWVRTPTTPAPSSGTGNISQVLTNTGPTSVTYTYQIWAESPAPSTCTSATITCIIVVQPGLTVAATANSATVCVGSPLSLSATVTPTGTYTYAWSGPNGYASTGANPMVSATAALSQSGTYTVVVTDAAGCSGTATATVSVINCCSLSATAGTPLMACAGNSFTLTGATSGTPVGPLTYAWTGPGGFVASGQTAVATATVSGTYTLVVTDTGVANCSATATVGVTVNPVPAFTVTPTNTTSCAGNSGLLTLNGLTPSTSYTVGYSANGTPVGPLTLTSNGSGQLIVSGLTAGSYTNLTVSLNGCPSPAQSATIADPGAPAAPVVTVAPSPSLCLGQSVTMTAGGAAGASFMWTGTNLSSTTGSPVTATPATAGSFTYTVTQSLAGCTSPAASVTVVVTTPPSVTALASSATVCVGSPLSLSATVTPTGTYTYAWSGPNGYVGSGANPTVSATAALTNSGTYTVVVTDAAGCSATATVPVSVSNCCINFALNQITSNAHCGQSDGGATITASGGTAPYTYSWSTGMSTSSVSGLAPGSYTVAVSDAIGCSTTALVTIGNTDGPQLALVSTTPATCVGATGTASVTASGGTSPYSYTWSTGAMGNTLSGVVAGTYSVTVADATGCRDVLAVTITSQPGSLTATIASTPPACGQATGTASVVASGGTSPYSYTWSNGATTASVSGLVAGTYSVTVTDANGCVVSSQVSINDVTGPTVVVSSTAVTCNGMGTGIALATVSGGTAPYSYSWSTGMSTSSVSGLAAGAYSVVVRDANGCQASGTVSVSEPAVLVAELSASTLACGMTTGDIRVVGVTGGTAPYTYRWSNGALSQDLTGVAAGTYSLTVTDANGCSATGSATLVLPTDCCSLTATAGNPIVACEGGMLNLTVTAGNSTTAPVTTPLTYVWSGPNGFTANTASPAITPATAAAAGLYSVTVTDGAGCTAISSVSVTISTAPSAGNDIVLSICNNETVDLATYFTAGGSFSALNGSITGSVFNGIASGVGSFTVLYSVGGNGCPVDAASAIIIVRNCSVLPCNYPVSSAVVDATCGSSDGRAEVAIGGLPAGATTGFIWSTGQTGPAIAGLAAGVYSVTATITTANGVCSQVDSIQVNEIGGPLAEIELITAADCQGANGAAAIDITSGTGPFRIVWSGAATGTQNGVNLGVTTIPNLAAGSYIFEITSTSSSTNCSAFLAITVPEDDSDRITVVGTPTNTTCGAATGSIVITATPAVGVTGPFSFSLNGVQIGTSPLPTFTVSGLAAGVYTVGVSSAGGCTAANVPVTIGETGAPAIAGWTPVSPLCPGDRGMLVFVGGQPTATFVVREVTTGAIVGNTISGASSTTLTLPAGAYSIEQNLTASTCTSFTTVTITVPEGLKFNVQYTKASCAPGGVPNNDGTIAILQITGGTPPYSTSVVNAQNQVASNLQALAPGVYNVQVLDSRGCSGLENVFITVPNCNQVCPDIPMSTFVVDANCGASDGRAVAQLGAFAESDVDYQWSNGFSGKNTNGLMAGVYSVTATVLTGTFVGCPYVETVNVNDIGGPVFEPRVINASTCTGATGTVSFSVISGTGPYVVTWTGPTSGSAAIANTGSGFTFNRTGLAAGDYVFTLTGSTSSCKSTQDVTIPSSSSSAIALTATPVLATSCGAQDGSINLTASGSGPNYTFTLNGVAYTSGSVSTVNIPNLPAGVYTVGVSATNGCTTERTVTIGETGAPVVSGWTSQSAICPTDNGQLIFAGGQSAAVTYRVLLGAGGTVISTVPGNTPAMVAVPKGIYVVERTETVGGNSCTSFQSFTISVPEGIDFNVQYTPESCGPGGVGNGDGTLQVVQINGGTPGYSVAVTNVTTGIVATDLQNLGGGDYFVRVVDANGCPASEDALVRVPPCQIKCPVLTFNTSVIDNECGQINGQATAALLGVPAGATATYLWSNGASGPIATGLAAGTYSVTATVSTADNVYNACKYVDIVTVNDIGGPVLSLQIATPASCTAANGSAVLNLSGTGPFQISWTGPATGSQSQPNAAPVTITGLQSGNYVFTLTGNGTCKSVLNVTIPSNSTTVINATATATNVTTCGAQDGRIVITVAGGVGPFTYSLNGYIEGVSSVRMFSRSGLPAGTYQVTVTDANGCSVTKTNVIINPAGQPPIAGWTPANALCPDDSGTLQYVPPGTDAGAAYVVTIANTATVMGQTTGGTPLTLSVPGGTYVITRTTSTSCVSVTIVTVNQPAGFDFNIQYNDPTCLSPASGSLTVVQPSGGTGVPPYSYTITGPAGVVSNAATAANLVPGSYTVTIGDANGCTLSDVVTLTGGSSFSVTALATPVPACISSDNVTITATVTPAGSYTYSFAGPNSFTVTNTTGITSFPATAVSQSGSYTVTATDINGCFNTAVASVTVQNCCSLSATAIASATTVCDGDSFTLTAGTSGTAVGTLTYTFSGPGGFVASGQSVTIPNAATTASGTYTLVVTDTGVANCSAVATTTVTVNPTPDITLAGGPACSTDLTSYSLAVSLPAGVTLSASAGTVSGNTVTGIPAGTNVLLTATSTAGCSTTLAVTAPNCACPIIPAPVGTDQIVCEGQPNPALTVTVGAGLSANFFDAPTGGIVVAANTTTFTPTSTSAGSYTVYVEAIDPVTGCRSATRTAVTLTISPALNVSLATSSPTVCIGSGNVTLTSTVTPTGSYTYSFAGPNGFAATNQTGTASFAATSVTQSGSYSVTVTDVNGCSGTAVVPLSVSNCVAPCPGLGISLVVTTPTCGSANGQITATATGGVTPYTFLWSDNQTTQTITGLSSGIYSVTLTDANGCTGTAGEISLPSSSGPVVNLVSVSPATCGQATGGASVSASGSVEPYTFQWSTGMGASTSSVSGLAAGTYTVSVSDANGCQAMLSVTVPGTNNVSLVASATPATCGSANGGASVVASGGNGSYTYAWSNGAGSASISGLLAGAYSVTVSDGNNCSAVATVNLTNISGPALTVSESSSVACNGASTGAAVAVVSGGTAPYSYVWSNGMNTSAVSGLSAGVYSVVVRDANGCEATQQVRISQAASLIASYGAGVIVCPATTANITQTGISGGTAPYSYVWSNGSGLASLSGVAAGSYTVVITDANGCQARGVVVIDPVTCPICQPPVLTVSTPICNTAGTGYTATFTNSAGSVVTASAGATISGTTITVGSLTDLIVTATNPTPGCAATTSLTIITPVCPTTACVGPPTLTVGQPVCLDGTQYQVSFSAQNGTVSVSAGGTINPITSTITAPIGTSLTVTITGGPGCGSQSIGVSSLSACDPTDCTNPLVSVGGTTCMGNGFYTVRFTAPTGVTITAGSSATITGNTVTAAVGTPMSLTASNGGVCSDQVVAIVSPVCPITVCVTPLLTLTGSPVCTTVAGGGSTYSVSFASSVTGVTASAGTVAGNAVTGIPIGTSVVITATNSVSGCSNSTSLTALSPTCPGSATCVLPELSLGQPVCLDGTRYAVSFTSRNGTVSVVGGTVTGAGSITALIGTNVTVSIAALDAACGSLSFVAASPTSCTSTTVCTAGQTLLSVAGPVCSGDGFYSVNITLPAGVTATSSTGVVLTASGSLTGLVVGTPVSLTASNGACAPQSISIASPTNCPTVCTPLGVNVVTTTPSCGSANGQITAQVVGGVAPYTYLWSNGQSGQTISGLSSGVYSVTVTDANSCSGTADMITLPDSPGPILSLVSVTPAACGQATGAVSVSASGSVPPYTYQWSSGQSTSSVSGLAAGMYTVSAFDDNGCEAILAVTIPGTSSLSLVATSTNATCGSANGTASVVASGGTTPYSYTWSNGANSPTLAGLTAGFYSVTVTDGSSCSAVATVAVNSISGPTLTVSQSNAACNGSSTGSATAVVSGGTAPYTYQWSNGMSTSSVSGLTAGTYIVQVRDANGCIATQQITITQPGSVVASYRAGLIVCPATTANITQASISGGTAPYSYSWSNGSATASLTAVAAGSYTVVITDANGCTAQGVVVIEPRVCPPCVDPLLTVTASPVCNTTNKTYSFTVASNGVSLTVAGGTLSGNTVTATLGTSVVVTALNSASGCASTTSLTVLSPTCPVSGTCVVPELSLGQPVCLDGVRYAVSYSFRNGTVGVAGGTITSATMITALVGTNVVVSIAATSADCGSYSIAAASPTSCTSTTVCTAGQEQISVAGPFCTGTGFYSVNFTAPVGVTVTASAGTISGNSIINIPVSQPVSITADNGVCTPQTVSLAAPTNCSPCSATLIIVQAPVCNVAAQTYSVNYIATPGTIVTANAGTVSPGAISGIPAGVVLSITATNGVCAQVNTVSPPVGCTTVVVCTNPILTLADPTCNTATGGFTVTYISNGVVTTSGGATVNTVTQTISVPAGVTAVTVTATSSVSSCTNATSLTAFAPTGCNSPTACTPPTLSVGQPECNGTTYSVAYTSSLPITTSAGASATITATTITAPIGTNLTVSAGTSATCSVSFAVVSPVSCLTTCEIPGISIAAPVCTTAGYEVRYVASAGGTVTASSGTVNGTAVTGIPSGSAVVITVSNGTCPPQSVTITAPDCNFCFTANVYLQGALVNGIGVFPTTMVTGANGEPLMRDDLRSLNLIPLADPYRTSVYSTSATARFTHVSNPYNETIISPATALAARGDSSVVDWVFLEFRSKANQSVVSYTRSALVLRNGAIVDVDGSSCLRVGHLAPDDYYVSVKHRNHLGVMTLGTVTIAPGAGNVNVDFRKLAPTNTWDSGAPLYSNKEQRVIPIGTGTTQYYALWGGNANRDKSTIFQGTSLDPIEVAGQVLTQPSVAPGPPANSFNNPAFILRGYYSGDVNMNGRTIFQGIDNEPIIIYNIMIEHPSNTFNNPAFIIVEQLP